MTDQRRNYLSDQELTDAAVALQNWFHSQGISMLDATLVMTHALAACINALAEGSNDRARQAKQLAAQMLCNSSPPKPGT